jgi:DNA-damage-inducible protein J
MAENAVVRTRIRSEVKDQATAVLEPMGLTVSDVMRIVITRVAHEGVLPFELTPNKLTRETLRKSARSEEVHRAKDAEDLFDQLEI